ncbi:ABC transporter permease [Clostridium sp. LP20]|uniref:ABC transporter permease n=1 Tax=Clostridium sp. LP20 TaxID=3418665 RepID=UPI003EE556E2
MRRIVTLVKNNLRILIIKKPIYSLLMIILPLVVTLFMFKVMNTGGKPIKVGVVDNSSSFTSSRIIDSLKDDEVLEIIKVNSEKELDEKFSAKDINLAIIFTKDFQDNVLKGNKEGVIVKGLEGEELYSLISRGLGIEVSNLTNLAKVNNGDYESYKTSVEKKDLGAIKISKEDLRDVKGDYNDAQSLIGFIIMFAFYRAMSGSGLINEDKEQYIYTRVMASTVKPWEYFLSNIISVIMLLVILFGLSIIGINFVSDVDLGVSSIQLMLILSLIAIVAVSIGTFCSTVTEDRDLSNIVSNIILVGFLALGGCFLPVSYFSDTVDKLSYFTPTRWAMEAVNNIQQGADLNIILMNFGAMLLFALVFFIASIYCIDRRDKVDSVK